MKMSHALRRFTIAAATAVMLIPAIASAQTAGAAPQSSRKVLMTKDLADFPGKEALVYLIDYPPGTNNLPHRHDAHVFLHILSGQLNAQVKGGELTVLNPGDTYYESPNDIHIVSRNPSSTTPAKAILFMVHNKGAALSTPVKE
jgi:quercetin dioxygenase-like cupin family protein